MSFIFVGSTNVLSSGHTSRYIGPFLRWINPSISSEGIRTCQYFIRKCGHVSEYAFLSVLILRARRGQRKAEDQRPFARDALFALMLCALYAASDEFHQSFYPSREASVMDVLIDSFGASMGLLVVWLFGRWRRWW